jgi:hypothetical protein
MRPMVASSILVRAAVPLGVVIVAMKIDRSI